MCLRIGWITTGKIYRNCVVYICRVCNTVYICVAVVYVVCMHLYVMYMYVILRVVVEAIRGHTAYDPAAKLHEIV